MNKYLRELYMFMLKRYAEGEVLVFREFAKCYVWSDGYLNWLIEKMGNE